MEIIIQRTAKEASVLAARIVAKVIRHKPKPVVGLATGTTPLELYKELIRMHREEGLDFSNVTTFNLDEYVGLPPEHHSSYNAYMHRHLFNHINLKPENINIPNGMVEDIPAFCEEYERKIKKAGGIDVQILGVGSDGHIAFNEPTSAFSSRTRIKTLTEQTQRDNAYFFSADEDVPIHVITMGIGTILDAKSCILLAFGEKKADAEAKLVEGPMTTMVPASGLQMHPDAKIIVDEPAGSKLLKKEYYQYVYAHKPTWQQY